MLTSDTHQSKYCVKDGDKVDRKIAYNVSEDQRAVDTQVNSRFATSDSSFSVYNIPSEFMCDQLIGLRGETRSSS